MSEQEKNSGLVDHEGFEWIPGSTNSRFLVVYKDDQLQVGIRPILEYRVPPQLCGSLIFDYGIRVRAIPTSGPNISQMTSRIEQAGFADMPWAKRKVAYWSMVLTGQYAGSQLDMSSKEAFKISGQDAWSEAKAFLATDENGFDQRLEFILGKYLAPVVKEHPVELVSWWLHRQFQQEIERLSGYFQTKKQMFTDNIVSLTPDDTAD